ncbi:MAG TPA: ornithine cyclodeaminase family protein [Alphaproteobacteria bacterium]|nr:ornithine cyclodeaminase family protein [Alphaproteobacteria bacterium]
MAIIITDDDVRRHLSMRECVDAMQIAFRDFANGKAVTLPRVRYKADAGDGLDYFCNVHVGAVPSLGMACVRAGSQITKENPDRPGHRTYPSPVNWTVILLYDIKTSEPVAFLHESYLSGMRVGATSAAAVDAVARADASELALFGSGRQARSHCRAICTVRPIERVRTYSPNPANREALAAELRAEGINVVPMDDPKRVVEGADIICCATSSAQPVFDGALLEKGQMVVSIANTDVTMVRREVDPLVLEKADDIIVAHWPSVAANGQIELSDLIAKGTVKRERVHELGDVLAGKAPLRQGPDNIIYFKNNTGLGMQFAAAGAIIYRKMIAEGGANRVVPREWLMSEKYSQS